MQKLKRILALLGAALLAAMYIATLVLALSGNPNTPNILMATIACTIPDPILQLPVGSDFTELYFKIKNRQKQN